VWEPAFVRPAGSVRSGSSRLGWESALVCSAGCVWWWLLAPQLDPALVRPASCVWPVALLLSRSQGGLASQTTDKRLGKLQDARRSATLEVGRLFGVAVSRDCCRNRLRAGSGLA